MESGPGEAGAPEVEDYSVEIERMCWEQMLAVLARVRNSSCSPEIEMNFEVLAILAVERRVAVVRKPAVSVDRMTVERHRVLVVVETLAAAAAVAAADTAEQTAGIEKRESLLAAAVEEELVCQ